MRTTILSRFRKLLLITLTAAGYKAIFLSVDVPMLGRRLNEHRNDFTLPEDMAWPNLDSTGKDELASQADGNTSAHHFGKPETSYAGFISLAQIDCRCVTAMGFGHTMVKIPH